MPGVEVHVVCCVRKPLPSPEKLAPNIFYHSLLVPKIGWMTTGYQGCIRAVRRKEEEAEGNSGLISCAMAGSTERDCAMEAVFSGFPNVLTIHGNMAELARIFSAGIGSFHWLAARLEGFSCCRARLGFSATRHTPKVW